MDGVAGWTMPGASYAHIASDMPRSAGSDSPSDSVSSVRVASPPWRIPSCLRGFSWAVLVWRPKRVRPDETDRRLGPVRTAQAHVPAACLAWRIIFILVYRALGVSKGPRPQAPPPENAGLAPERLLCRPVGIVVGRRLLFTTMPQQAQLSPAHLSRPARDFLSLGIDTTGRRPIYNVRRRWELVCLSGTFYLVSIRMAKGEIPGS